ncbi:MAG: hypothetical protein H7Z72_13570 [Bacteroidetes bacterium]|nr:hypothetical protein [Fibrella sp.]
MELRKEELIYQMGELSILVRPIADQSAIDLLKRTVYGTVGVRYQQTGQQEKVSHLQKPFYFHLYQHQQLIGLYCLDERVIPLVSGHVPGFYGRYLAIDDSQKGNGYGQLLKREAVSYIELQVTGPVLFYSYIEEKNTRSLAISQGQSFQSVAALRTFIVRRHSPSVDSRFERLDPSELSTLLALLNDAYRGYRFKTFAHIGYQSNYFVLKEGHEIVAGIQANPVCWRFNQMPGVGGWVTMHLLPLISLTRRYFDPAHYRFLVPEGLYLKPGREELLGVLLESTLAHFGLHSMLFQVDQKAALTGLLARRESGVLSRFQPVTTQVMVKARGIPSEQLPANSPVYVSSFDFS